MVFPSPAQRAFPLKASRVQAGVPTRCAGICCVMRVQLGRHKQQSESGRHHHELLVVKAIRKASLQKRPCRVDFEGGSDRCIIVSSIV